MELPSPKRKSRRQCTDEEKDHLSRRVERLKTMLERSRGIAEQRREETE
jgi:hypothetical protein